MPVQEYLRNPTRKRSNLVEEKEKQATLRALCAQMQCTPPRVKYRSDRRPFLYPYLYSVRRTLLAEKLAYYGGKCRYCGIFLVQGENLSWDHAIPVSRGGIDMLSNLLPCCRKCNRAKFTKTFFEFLGRTDRLTVYA
jgi:5-methylcytosine-specific restriction endonuclease McrA